MLNEIDNSSLTDDTKETPVTDGSEGAVGTGQDAGASGQPPIQPPVASDVYDYTKDERLKTMWSDPKTKSFDPNRMYKSYKNAEDLIEKQYKPLRSQAENFAKVFKDYGYQADIEEIRTALEELKGYKDPENPIIKRGNYLSYYYDNPEYKPEVESFFETLRKREVRKQFGEGVSDEIVNEIIANRQYREEQTRKEKMAQEAEQHKQLVGTIEQGWQRVVKETKEVGFPVNEDIRQRLLDVCAEEQVDPRFMYAKFMDLYKDEIRKYERAKWQSEANAKRKAVHKSGIIPASSKPSGQPQNKSGEKPSMFERVASNLGLK